ncbi:hypothetical protein AB0O50_08975 [Streptomyces cyaneofuscatus]|uniref:hypothetical protein n=1 Tax=Streptomyces cyaneofuscatus TaxID=66883 RepID=UPI0034174D78
MVTLPTTDGGTVTVTRCGELVDLHVRDSSGRTVATVTRRAGEAVRLLAGYTTKSSLNRPS